MNDSNTNLVIPNHIAIIMDGNGRWAKEQGISRTFGHRAGHSAVLKTVKHAVNIGIESLTLFAFSSENWLRPQSEVKALMFLFSQAIKHNKKLFMEHNIRFNVIGDVSRFSPKLQKEITALEEATTNHYAMTVNIAANYGGKWDIVQAAKILAKQVQLNEIMIDDIDEARFDQTLTLADQCPVDLLIRTGGEQRISNYLLWDCAYAELYFDSVFWPNFDETSLDNAITDYQRRTRRFGKVLDID